jgi:hypothetical protein
MQERVNNKRETCNVTCFASHEFKSGLHVTDPAAIRAVFSFPLSKYSVLFTSQHAEYCVHSSIDHSIPALST